MTNPSEGDPEWAKYLTDPPCKCGNDLGLEGGPQPRYVPQSAGSADPKYAALAAVEVPPGADITVVMGTYRGRATGRFTLTPGGYHVMASPGGQQYTCSASLVGVADKETMYVRSLEPLPECGGEGAYDPRVVMLRHFWAGQGYPDVPVWGLRRVKPVRVRGKIELVRVRTRWFTANGVFRDLGATHVVQEPDGVLRFLTDQAMAVEFHALLAPDGSHLRTF